MFCLWFVLKDIPRDHPRHLNDADDDSSKKVQCAKNNIQNFHDGTPPLGILLLKHSYRPEETISNLPRTFLREGLTTCDADSTLPPFSGIFSVSYFLRKHKIFDRHNQNAAAGRAKKNAPLTNIRGADIMNTEKVLTSKRLAPYQITSEKLTALCWKLGGGHFFLRLSSP